MVCSGDVRVSGDGVNDVDLIRDRLARMGGDAADIAFAVVEGLADVWVRESQRVVPVDTGQLRARTAVVSVRSAGVAADADLMADTPYAGFVEYGTRYVGPRPFFRGGRDEAARVADGLGGRLESELRRTLDSGGVWNPRSLF